MLVALDNMEYFTNLDNVERQFEPEELETLVNNLPEDMEITVRVESNGIELCKVKFLSVPSFNVDFEIKNSMVFHKGHVPRGRVCNMLKEIKHLLSGSSVANITFYE